MASRLNLNIRLTIFHRAMLMSVGFVLIIVIALGLVLNSISDMLTTIEGNEAYLETQNVAVNDQNKLINQQERLMHLQTTTLEAYAFYSSYLYWRFDSVITADDRSIAEAAKAEKGLREKLTDIASQDDDLAEAAEVVLIYIDDFNATMSEAVERTKNDAPRHLISAKVGEAQSHSIAMNAMFDTILEQSANAVSEASKGVKVAGAKVSDAADQVLAASKDVSQKGHRLESQVWLIMLAAVVISLALGTFLSRSITKPIRRLTSVIVDIEKNSDLSRRINYRGRNEIGDIGIAFNSMLEKFHSIIQQLAKSADQLSDSSEESAKVSERTNNSSQNLREETDMVATASNEMAVTVKGINESTEDAVKKAADAQDACQRGQQIITQTVDSIESLTSQINSSSTAVQDLVKETESIGSVLDVIRGIAEQTNLLALNAAIEAARAGEQGRGFAVVADEVRSLASKTGDSTEEIQTMIEKLQAGANNAASQMKLSASNTNQTLDFASQTTESINGILESVDSISTTNQHIAHATEEQSTAANSIDQSIVRISQLTNDVSAAAEHTLEASEQLSEMVDEIHSLVVQFKH